MKGKILAVKKRHKGGDKILTAKNWQYKREKKSFGG
jgi:hypothetical protein